MNFNDSADSLKIYFDLPRHYHQFKIIHRILRKIFIPYIFTVASLGIVTNTATVVLLSMSFFTKSLKNKWTLNALALSDLLFNIALLCRGIQDLIKQPPERFCVIISFLSHLAELLSASYIVSFTIERYMAVHHPLQVVTQRQTSPLISSIVIFICSLLFCAIISTRASYDDCHEDLSLFWFSADAVVSFVIPSTLILIFNVLIVLSMRQHSQSLIHTQSILVKRKRTRSFAFNNPKANIKVAMKHSKVEQNQTKFYRQCNSPINESIIIELSRNNIEYFCLFSVSTRSNVEQRLPQSMTNSQTHSTRLAVSVTLSTDNRTGQSVRMTKTLILVSTCFLILNAPVHISIIAAKIYTNIETPLVIQPSTFASLDNQTSFSSVNETSNELKINGTSFFLPIQSLTIVDHIGVHLIYITVLFAQYISYASYSINFFLYSFSGVAFRTIVQQTFRKLWKFQR